MLGALATKLQALLRGDDGRRAAPVHGAHGRARNVEYVFRQKDYPGSRDRHYLVHLPPAYRRGRKLPVVMILHGCDQTHHDIRHVANFDALADKHGFIVVYPFVTSYDPPRLSNCWAAWSRKHIRSGAGEVEDLWRILRDVRNRYGADAARLHVAGLSSGGSMAIALLVSRCDKIASGAAIAGLPYSDTPLSLTGAPHAQKSTDRIVAAMDAEMGRRKRHVPLMIVHATRDRIIGVDAAARVQESWGKSFDLPLERPSAARTGSVHGTAWEHRRYATASGGTALETLLLSHSEHGWYGGRDGKYGFVDAPDVSASIWRFFAANRLDESAEPRRLLGLLKLQRTA